MENVSKISMVFNGSEIFWVKKFNCPSECDDGFFYRLRDFLESEGFVNAYDAKCPEELRKMFLSESEMKAVRKIDAEMDKVINLK